MACQAGSSRQRSRGREITVVVVLIRKVGISRQLIAGIRHTAIHGPVADRIIRKGLRIEQQRMAGSSHPIQLIVAEVLRAASICQTRPIPHAVVDIVRLVDGGAGGRELMQDCVTGLAAVVM